jgi:hypothetical protein
MALTIVPVITLALVIIIQMIEIADLKTKKSTK